VNDIQFRAQTLLEQWHIYRNSGSCVDLLDIQQAKDYMDKMSEVLTAQMYCSLTDIDLSDQCDRFEFELFKFKNKLFKDLISGLQVSIDK